jgi:hypothetical protein
MRPLEGVIIGGSTKLLIRLRSGATVSIPRRNDLKLGDTCFVLFDYTRLEVRDVWSEEEYYALEDDGPCPVFEEEGPPDREEPYKWAMMSDPCLSGVSL